MRPPALVRERREYEARSRPGNLGPSVTVSASRRESLKGKLACVRRRAKAGRRGGPMRLPSLNNEGLFHAPRSVKRRVSRSVRQRPAHRHCIILYTTRTNKETSGQEKGKGNKRKARRKFPRGPSEIGILAAPVRRSTAASQKTATSDERVGRYTRNIYKTCAHCLKAVAGRCFLESRIRIHAASRDPCGAWRTWRRGRLLGRSASSWRVKPALQRC